MRRRYGCPCFYGHEGADKQRSERPVSNQSVYVGGYGGVRLGAEDFAAQHMLECGGRRLAGARRRDPVASNCRMHAAKVRNKWDVVGQSSAPERNLEVTVDF